MAVSNTPGDVIKTMALGSCVGIVALDPKAKAVGMIHIVLPDSQTNIEKAKVLPGYFVDTGIPVFLEKMKSVGTKNYKDLILKMIGGSEIGNTVDQDFQFDIGKRNILAVKKKLWSLRLGVAGEDISGKISRTVSVAVSNGKVIVTNKGQSWQV